MSTRRIEVNYLARVEGEGALHVRMRDGHVEEAEFRIFEPPRFFEAFLRGRDFREAPDITARICGICPVAYQMSASHAMEDACGVEVRGPLRDLRRLLYCGEWIESHTLHIYLLHAPDFLGLPDAFALAREAPGLVRRGLQLKKAGNAVMSLLGGREIHPVNVRLGGFYRVPRPAELAPLAEQLKWAREAALDTVRWVAGFDFPEYERDYEFVALWHPEDYPIDEGRIASSSGLDLPVSGYDEWFTEEQVERSNALHSVLKGRGAYCTGPMARYALNFDHLSPLAQEAAREAGLGTICRNPFQSIIVRAVEVLYACDEALRIIADYQMPGHAAVPVEAREATGYGATEAPRGLLYHRYTIDRTGVILAAKIVPPTAQNQKSVEADLRSVVERYHHLPDAELTWRCEQTVRNYDPCISCATHFLRLRVERHGDGARI